MGVIGIIGYIVQARLQSVFAKYSQVPFPNGMTGAEVAEKMLRDNNVHNVKITHVAGQLTDHFNLNKYIGLAITLAVCVGPYIIIDHIYNRTGGRGVFVFKYFKNSQYDKIGWKALVLAVWVILWMVLPLVLYILHKKGEI